MQADSKVKEFWTERATEQNHTAAGVTHKDVWQHWLEIETIKKFLSPDQRLLDAGCGNGYGARLFAPLVREVVGVDYSESMVERARADSERDEPRPSFHVGDVLSLSPEQFGQFDVVI